MARSLAGSTRASPQLRPRPPRRRAWAGRRGTSVAKAKFHTAFTDWRAEGSLGRASPGSPEASP
eukprot:6505979-Alexandrium_andersonii.AAC.1